MKHLALMAAALAPCMGMYACGSMSAKPARQADAASAAAIRAVVPDVAASAAPAASAVASASQPEAAAPNSAWDRSWGGADKSHDSRLLAQREQIAPLFRVLAFRDPANGVAMEYNLFVPKGYNPQDASKRYPLVMFIADASTVGKGVKAPLMQGWGGIVWASDAVQDKHPAFVLVPSYTGSQSAVNDRWQTGPEVDTTLRLLESVMSAYRIDESRVYATGQSMGGMIAFYLNSRRPGLFAASMFVGSQWDINALQLLAKAKFIYTVSAADPKAAAGMKQVGEMLAQRGVPYGQTEFAATLPQAQQDARVDALLRQNYRINFIRFTPGTVMPPGASHPGGEHMYSFDHAYLLAPARSWLLEQSKDGN